MCVRACVGVSVKMRRYNLFLSDNNGGNSFLKWDGDGDEEGLINMNIIMLSLAGNQVMASC